MIVKLSEIYIKFILRLTLLLFSNTLVGQEKYFQQQVDTKIDVILNDSLNTLSCKEKIVYYNNSPNTLDSIIIHLWPNAYKNINTALSNQLFEEGNTDLKYASLKDKGNIDSLNFTINGKSVNWHYFNNQIDIAVIQLKEPLKPQSSITIETPFSVKIPSGNLSRLGHIGQSYQITQWFPKPAVYDNNGWHPMSYLNQGEFYSEFGNYDVSITVPKNYILMATGDLQNKEEIKFLNKKAEETQRLFSENKLPLRDSNGKKVRSFPKSSRETKTLRFTQKNVHDFAWFADKRYHVLKGKVTLPKSNKEITTWALFTNREAKLWKYAIEYLNDATLYFSKWVGEYPYNHVTAVDGTISAGGGMEYPNITVIGTSGNHKSLETVIIHEVGHNWYYGILGSNERDHAWMDEGLNTYIEIRYMEEKYRNGYKTKIDSLSQSNTGLNITINLPLEEKSIHRIGYIFNASRNMDQPLQMESKYFTSLNYGGMVYSKTGLGFHYLKDYLGEKLFDKSMNNYFNKWKFKHPQPENLREVFESSTRKNLSWFFDDYINSTKKVDYNLNGIKEIKSNEYLIKLKNKTGYSSPIPIQAIIRLKDSVKIINEKWIDGFKKDTIIKLITDEKPSHITIDHNLTTPDFNYFKHIGRTSGLLKFTKPVKFKFIPTDIKNNEVNYIHWFPLIGWNAYDKLMPGLAFYNKGIKTKQTEWLLNPFYSSENKVLNGIGEISHYFNTNILFKRIELGYKIKSFSSRFESTISNDRWIKQEAYGEIQIRESQMRYSPSQKITVRGIKIDDHFISGYFISPPKSVSQTAYYSQIKYNIQSKQILKPRSLELSYTYGLDNENKTNLISSLQLLANAKLNYNKELDALEIRVFAGYNFHTKNSRYNLFLRGQDGYYDYLYDRSYLGRNLNYPATSAQQSSISQGAFKINTGLGGSDSWLISSNFLLKLPKLPLRLFTDFGVYPTFKYNANTQQSITSTQFLYNFGLNFNISLDSKTIIGFYLPLLYSDEIDKSFIPGTNKPIESLSLLQKITFVLNLNEINPFKIKKNIRP